MINGDVRGGWLYRAIFAAARRLDAEQAHQWGMAALRLSARVPGGAQLLRRTCVVDDPALRVRAFGCDFPSPLGLAAGFDKDARAATALAALGFGFVEVGTVTAVPQAGNPRPRLYRLVGDRAIVNRMGFNNDGAAAVAERLKRLRERPSRPVVGVNIGKSQVVPGEHAIVDYVASARRLAPHADYLVVNVSSPNTPGLRDLHAVARLRPLLIAVREASGSAAGRRVPLLVKIAPDLADTDILAVADLAGELRLDGIIATNTTTARRGLRSSPVEIAAAGAGGLSGEPLRDRSMDVLRLLRSRAGENLALISVGGIATADEAWNRLQAGATLVQAYTAFVYGGPLWSRRVTAGLSRLAHRTKQAES
ncbi:MAG TPA: quinone-dependent dihydroorotate dehydrogenase [Jiangellaceae bacterium]|nr:quinone-dependent dihydroorotate dehydrogenase [Jiangellaceae bacterium]